MSAAGRGDGKIIHLPEEHDLQLSALYHQADAPRPSASLEQRILVTARQAAAEAIQRKQSLSRRRVPLPLAAALLVVAGLAPLLLWHGDQGGFSRHTPEPALPLAVEDGIEPAPPADEVPLLEPQDEAGPGPEPASPETQELMAIQALIEAGRDVEAWERFTAFRTEFPAHRIPDALLDQLAGVRARLLEAPGGR